MRCDRWWRGSLLLGVAVCAGVLAYARPGVSNESGVVLTGQVRDPLGNPLPGVVVEFRLEFPSSTDSSAVASQPLRVVRCDAAGRFRAVLPSNLYRVRAGRVDRVPWEATVPLVAPARPLLIVLHEKTLRTPPVRVSAQRPDATRESNGVTLTHAELNRKIGGLEDVLRSVQDQPGVSAPSDLHAELLVRGGDNKANAVYLDGIEIMFPYHILGFNSVLSPDLVHKADFYAGNAPLAWSGASGGVLVVESRGGRPEPPAAQVGLSWLSGHAQGNVGTDRAGVAFSMRRSYHDKLAEILGNVPDQQIPTFHEVHLRGTWVPRSGHQWTAGVLVAGDGMSIPSPELQAQNYSLLQSQGDSGDAADLRQSSWETRGGRLRVANDLAVFSVQHAMSPRPGVRLQTTLGWVPQSFDFRLDTRDHERMTVHSSVATLQQSARRTGREHTIEFGWRMYRDMTIRRVDANAGLLQLREGRTSLHLHDQHERYDYRSARLRGAAMIHATHEWHPTSLPMELETGLRLEHDTLTGDTGVDPRVAFSWHVAPEWRAQATWGRTHTLHDKYVEIAPTESGAPLHAEVAVMRTLGIEGHVQRWSLGATAWSKSSSSLVYEIRPALYANGARGEAHGVDGWVEWGAPGPGWTNRLQYSWAETRQLNPYMFRRNVLPGATDLSPRQPLYETPYWFHPQQDLRHQMSWTTRFERGRWEFGSQLRAQSGRPWTPVETTVLDGRNWPVGIEARQGSARLPGYFRWDVRFARHFRWGASRWNVYAEVLNLTRSRNVYQYRYDPHYEKLIAVMMLPTLPTLGFEARF